MLWISEEKVFLYDGSRGVKLLFNIFLCKCLSLYCYKSVIHDDKPSKFSENPERLITGQPPRLFTDQQAKAHKFKSIVSEQFYTQSIIRNIFWNRNEDPIQDKNSCVKHGDSTWGMIVPFAPQRNCPLKNMNCPPTLSSPF